MPRRPPPPHRRGRPAPPPANAAPPSSPPRDAAAPATPSPTRAPVPAPATAPSPLHPAEAPRLEVVRDAGTTGAEPDAEPADTADEQTAVDLAGYLSAAEAEPELHADDAPTQDEPADVA